MRRLRSPAGALVTFGAGALVMVAFDTTLTLIAGVVMLLTGIGLGVVAIATDEFIADDDGG